MSKYARACSRGSQTNPTVNVKGKPVLASSNRNRRQANQGNSEHHQASNIQVAIIRSSATIIQRKLARNWQKQTPHTNHPAMRSTATLVKTKNGNSAIQPKNPRFAGKKLRYCSTLDKAAKANSRLPEMDASLFSERLIFIQQARLECCRR